MQLTALFIYAAALTSTAMAMPHFAGPYHGAHAPVHVPTNATSAHNATSTSTGGKHPLPTGSSRNDTSREQTSMASDAIYKINVNHCHELCSLESQACSLAVPEDDKFWYV